MEFKQSDNFLENRLGSILVEEKLLSERDIEAVLRVASEQSIQFGEAAIKLNLVKQEDIDYALAKQFEYPYLRNNAVGFSSELIAAFKPFSSEVEALRILRSQLKLKWFSDSQKTLAIMSPRNNEGRTYLAANLAIVFSQLGERTLLIDTDMRNPNLAGLFKVDSNYGLSAVLNGRTLVNDALIRIPQFRRLKLLPAGIKPPNPQELLTKKTFGKLINVLDKAFDIIIFDTPPGNENTDAQIVASKCKGALLVAKQNYSKYAEMKSMIELLTEANVKVVGSVFCKA